MINYTGNKPTLPRDASSVVIIRKIDSKLFLLMGRRPESSKFMPGIYVFPGGAIDKTDFQVNKLFNLSTTLKRNLLKSMDINRNQKINRNSMEMNGNQ